MSRRRRYSGYLIAFTVLVAVIVLAVAVAIPRLRLAALQSEISGAVLAEASAQVSAQAAGDTPRGQTSTSDIVVEGNWAFGLIVTRAPDGIHAEPDLKLFLTRRDESSGRWDAAVEYTPEFYALIFQAPPTLFPQAARPLLLEQAAQAQGRESATAPRALIFALPWQAGQTWTMTGGPHPDSGVGSNRPWSAIDLAYGPGVGVVRAAESGIVWRSSDCPNFVRIDHTGGYRTGYYHMVNERVSNGQAVLRGDAVGDEGMGTGCGGYTTGPHVHFSLRYGDTRLDINDKEFAGWVVQDGSSPYNGCMRRISDNMLKCTPSAQITFEEGILPVINDLRYEYNGDARPDLWAVNLRPSDGGTVTIDVWNGTGFASAFSVPRTSLPQQPVDLNTAFAAGDYNNDGTSDVWLFHRRADSSGTTAVRIVNGAEPRWLLLDSPTALPQYGDDVRFGVADYNRDGVLDIYAIVPDYAANVVRVKVVSGANPLSLIADRTVAMNAPSVYADVAFAVADYDTDGRPDLWAITPRDGSAAAARVRIFSGNNFQTQLVNTTLPLPVLPTDPLLYNFIVTDYNRDGTPDVWYLDRKSGQLTILSGTNFTTVLVDGPTGAVKTHKLQWQILGSDRARMLIAPQQPVLRSPPDATLVTNASVELEFTASGLSKKSTVKFSDALGNLLALGNAPKAVSDGCVGSVCTLSSASVGLQLRDGQRVFWNVTAKNAWGSSFSETRYFTVELPGPVSIDAPVNGAVLTEQPNFEWQPNPNADRYKLIVKNLVTKVKSKLDVPGTSCIDICAVTVGLPLENGQYNVKVKSFDAFGGSSKGPKNLFTVNVAPRSDGPPSEQSAPSGFRGIEPTPVPSP